MCSNSGASHIGSALSVIDILSVLYGEVAQVTPDTLEDFTRQAMWEATSPACCTEGCIVEPDGSCPHGCPSILIALGLI